MGDRERYLLLKLLKLRKTLDLVNGAIVLITESGLVNLPIDMSKIENEMMANAWASFQDLIDEYVQESINGHNS